MPIAIKCPGCGKSYNVSEDLAGKRVKCKCGQAVKVPDAAAKPNEIAGLDPLGSLLDAELPPVAAGTPAGGAKRPAAKKPSLRPGGTPSGESAPAKAKKRKKITNESGDLTPMASLLLGLGVVAGVLLVGAVIAFAVMWSFRPGHATPEAAFAAHQEALFKGNWKSLIRAYSAESQAELADRLLALASSSMIESSSFVKDVLKKHGVDVIMEEKDEPAGGSEKPSGGDPENAAEEGEEATPEDEEAVVRDYAAIRRAAEERRKKAVSAIENKAAFYADFMEALEAEREKQLPENPVLRVLAKKPEGEARRTLAGGTLDNLKIDGDTAKGEMSLKIPGEDEEIVAPVIFKKSGGRWFLHVPSAEDFDGSPMRSALDGGAIIDF